MRPPSLRDKLNELLEAGLVEGVFMAVQPHMLDGPARLQTLAPVTEVGMVSPGGISGIEFVALLEENRYSAVFADGALLAIQCTFTNDRLRSHRYSYIPCPVDPDLLMLRPEEITFADWLRDSIFGEGIGVFRSFGTYRFDCVRTPPERSTAPHPVSHFTFGSAECRLPLRGPMSVADFLNFLFDNFYRRYRRFWLNYAPHLDCEGTDSTITWEEQQLHHIQWMEPL